MQKLRPRAIIFDLGSTLIEYETVPWEQLNLVGLEKGYRFLKKSGFDPGEWEAFSKAYEAVRQKHRDLADSKQIEWTIPQAVGELLGKLGIENENGLADKFFDAYYKPVDKSLYIYDDTIEMLTRLKQRYPTIGLVSNTIFPERTHLGELKRFKIEAFLSFTIFSSTFGLRKPHPEIFSAAANQAGFAPSECVYIGDRYLEDVTGPGSIGMHAILKVKKGREYPSDMPEEMRRIECLSDLVDHIELG